MRPYSRVRDVGMIRDVLRMFVDRWMGDPEIKDFTHIRAEFAIDGDGTAAVEWKLMEADEQTIHSTKSIFLGGYQVVAVESMVRPFWRPGAERGQLTFRFNPPAVMLDLFDNENTTLVAEFIIDEGKLS